MKKLLYLFIATALLISCESDEDDNLDPIIGKWQLQSFLVNGDEESTECDRKTTVTFNEDGTFSNTSFYNDGNSCESEFLTSTWKKISDSVYRVDSDDENATLVFSENNTVFSGTSSVTEDGITFTIIITYKKI
jgi:heat shock protein HslJ